MKVTAVLTCCCIALAAQAGAAVLDPAVRVDAKDTAADEALYKLPEGFLVGAGVSATQAEGAASEDGKSMSVIDAVVHAANSHYKEVNDESADHYHLYKEDLALAKAMKLKTHRFSISWARIFPSGDVKKPNALGIKFYHDYIKEVKLNGMEPFVTMYHFDHPYSLEQSTNGWSSAEMVPKFVEYANYLFEEYGPEIKYWNPINEGNMYCKFMPAELYRAKLSTVDPELTFYKCIHNMVLAHAQVYRLYREKYFESQKGQVGTSVLMWPMLPQTLSFEDMQAADMFNDLFTGTIVHPLVYGDYPPTSRYIVDKRSLEEQNLTESKLPYFTSEEKKLFEGGATDFLALNVYNTYRARYTTGPASPGPQILQPVTFDLPFVKIESGGGFTNVDPDMMKTAMLWAWNKYHLPLVITENGYGDTRGAGVHDAARISYLCASLRSFVRTANEFKIPVVSYYLWSLMDVFEFSSGYDGRPFGLIHVDYKGKTLARTLKDSSKFMIKMEETGYVPSASSSCALTLAPAALTATLLSLLYR